MSRVIFWPCDVRYAEHCICWESECGALVVIDFCSQIPFHLPCDLTLKSPSTLQQASSNAVHIDYCPPNIAAHQLLSLDAFSFQSDKRTRDVDVQQEILLNAQRRLDRLDFTAKKRKGIDLKAVIEQINGARSRREEIRGRPMKPHTSNVARGKASSVLKLAFMPFELLSFLWSMPLSVLQGNALIDVSATARQFDVRLTQLKTLPKQLSNMRNNNLPVMRRREEYVAFYNTLWLIANDLIIGIAISTFLKQNQSILQPRFQHYFQSNAIDQINDALLRLNKWPAGLKLNDELGQFFGDAFMWFLSAWSTALKGMSKWNNTPYLFVTIANSSNLGATFFLSFASDLISLLSVHLYIFYLASTSIYHWHLSVLLALFNIFRGKKYNVIRERTEPSAYGVDQQFVGTILFTLTTFLFPTVLAYYWLFVLTRISIIILHASSEVVLAFLNHFTLFAVMLKIKDPARLPGGIRFEPSRANQGRLMLRNNPIPLSAIFSEFLLLSSRLVRHYNPVDLFWKVLQGRSINSIQRYRLVYGFPEDVLEKDILAARQSRPVL